MSIERFYRAVNANHKQERERAVRCLDEIMDAAEKQPDSDLRNAVFDCLVKYWSRGEKQSTSEL